MYSTIRHRAKERKVAQGAKIVAWIMLMVLAHGAYTLFTLGFERIYGQ